MVTRRALIASTAAAGLGAAGWLTAARLRAGSADYERAVRHTWRPVVAEAGNGPAGRLELVRYATLAPSSHNTQCWKFELGGQSISIHPDLQRRCPVVDPDDHHLFVSLGCAAENLVQAAAAMGLHAEAEFDSGPRRSIDVSLARSKAHRTTLFEAIVHRQTTRGDFDGRPLASSELNLLETAGSGPGVRVQLLTDTRAMEDVLEYVVQANTLQMQDPAFRRELKRWIRFNGGQAVRHGDGLYAAASGNPTAPGWLGGMMFDWFVTAKPQNAACVRQVRSSAGIAVFVSEHDDTRHWIEAGRAFQRFALQATALDVRTAHLNQPVELASLRSPFARSLGIRSGRPDLVVRFGRGALMPRSLRRPVEAVLA
jgi:hypothetical protein